MEDLERAQGFLESITEIFEDYRAERTVREEQRQWVKGLVSDESDARSLLDNMHSLTQARHGPERVE